MRGGVRGWTAALCAVALLLVLGIASQPAVAATTVPFTSKFSTNANGAILTIGNSLLTCSPSSSCSSAQGGAAADNNGFTMVNLDADGMAGTTNSSSSQLDLPAGATVLWAGLYWGARLQAGTNGQAGSAGAIGTMSLRSPGDSAYRSITASTAARDQFGPNNNSYGAYQRYADITAIVRSAGNGDYWGANVTAATGQDRYAGWAMTVVYTAPGLPLRNLTVFDGFNVVSNGSPQTVQVSGFLAPQSGTVDAQLTMVAYEGDLAQTGDFTRLNSTQLATPLSPGSNFFDSTNDRFGVSVTTRNPSHRNMLGFDIKNLGASGTIPNSATSATFTFSSNGDVYYPGVVGLAINLYAPDFTASSKNVVDLNGNTPSRPGNTLQYTLNYANTGQDAAVGVTSEDPLPPNTTYVPGSLALVNPVTGVTTPLTDAAGDDQGEVTDDTVRVRLGSGATSTAGGRMACSGAGCNDDGTSRAAYTFQVTVDDAAGGSTVTNLAQVSYRTATTNTPAVYTTNPASVDVVRRADVSIEKQMSPDPAAVGAAVSGTLTVRNDGPNPATDVIATDALPEGWLDVIATTTTGSCTVTGGSVSCALGDLASGDVATITLEGRTAPDSSATTLTNVASVSTTAFDPTPTNNVSSATVTLTRRAALSIAKTAVTPTARPGDPVAWTVTVTNAGPSDAQSVLITDGLDTAGQARITDAQITVTAGTNATCASASGRAVRCAIGTLPAGATATVTVNGILAPYLTEGAVVGNTARVASSTPDDTGDNSASAVITVVAPGADVRLEKSGPLSVIAGATIAWTVTATNFGPSDATGVIVTDTVPDGVVGIGATTSRGDPCTITGQVVSCAVGALPAADPGVPGAAVTITITGTVAPDATGPLRNTATATATTADPDTGNNTAAVDTTVAAEYDLAVSKTANRTALPAAVPVPVTYTISVTNNGPSAARDVLVRDLPPLVLDLLSASGPGATCDTTQADVPQPGDPGHGLISCTIAGPIEPGGAAVITVAMQANQVLAGGPDVVQPVSISAPGDTSPDNNSAQWTLTGVPVTDLALAKSAPETVTAGSTATYTFDITNNPTVENLRAIRPVLTDSLPAGVAFVSATVVSTSDSSAQSVACTTTGPDIRCQLGNDVAGGVTVRVAFTVSIAPDAPPGSALTNVASVESGNPVTNPDPTLANNTSTATTVVVADADVAVTELSVEPTDPTSTGPGSLRTVHTVVTNNGPSTARNVTIRIQRSEDAFLVDPGTQPADCQNTAREIVCTVDTTDLAPGQSVTIDYVIQVAAYVSPGSYLGSVQVASSTPDPVPSNNIATAPTIVTEAVTDLAVTKTAVGTVPNPHEVLDPHDSFVAGGPFSYRFTVTVPAPGTGLSDAQGVVLTDVLPIGFIAQQAATTRGDCTITPTSDPATSGDSLSCAIGTVNGWLGDTAPQPVVITVHGVLDPDANNLNGGDAFAEQVPNTATVTTDTLLVGGGSEVSATTAVDIIEQADMQMAKTPDQDAVSAGGSIGYTLTVINAGPSSVEHAVVTDSLPVGFSIDLGQSDCPPPLVTDDFDETLAQPQVADGPGQEFACRLGAVAAGTSKSIHVVATTDPTMAAGTATNTVTVGSLANEAEAGNNTATADVAVQRLTNLAISSTVSTNTPAAGEDITFTGFALNNGPSTAVGTTGDTYFPTGFVPVSVDVPFNDCTWNRPPPPDPTTAPWEDFQYVLHCQPITPGAQWEPGGAATNVVVMHIPGDTPGGPYSGRSVIRSDTPEIDLTDNETTQTVVVQLVSDTSLVKTLIESDPLLAGRSATYRLTATNNGPSVAQNVTISDTIPPGMTFFSAQIEGGAACPAPETYDTGQGDTQTLLRCNLGTLAVDTSASMLVTLDVGADQGGATLCNTAIVGSNSLDPDASDNESQACGPVAVPPAADVSIALAPVTQTHASGSDAELTATIRNNGPGPATDIVATIELPDGFSDVTGVAVEWPAGRPQPPDGVPGSLVFDVGDLSPGEQVVYRLVGVVSGEPGAVLPIQGVVTHNEPDSVSSNDTAQAELRIVGASGPTSPGPLPPTGADPTPSGPLPPTGADVLGPLGLAIAAIAVGLALLALRRRPERQTNRR